MRRVMIIGGSGSGKSTLARHIGAALDLPVVHIDPMYWKPGWVQRPAEETHAMIHAALSREAWVFEGNHSATMDARAARADLIVFLDMPRWLRLWRFTNRWWRYRRRSRPDMTPGCNDRWSYSFVRDYIWRYHQDARPMALANTQRWSREGRRVVQLRSRGEVRRFLADLTAGR